MCVLLESVTYWLQRFTECFKESQYFKVTAVKDGPAKVQLTLEQGGVGGVKGTEVLHSQNPPVTFDFSWPFPSGDSTNYRMKAAFFTAVGKVWLRMWKQCFWATGDWIFKTCRYKGPVLLSESENNNGVCSGPCISNPCLQGSPVLWLSLRLPAAALLSPHRHLWDNGKRSAVQTVSCGVSLQKDN